MDLSPYRSKEVVDQLTGVRRLCFLMSPAERLEYLRFKLSQATPLYSVWYELRDWVNKEELSNFQDSAP
jgi:hypothetical protein